MRNLEPLARNVILKLMRAAPATQFTETQSDLTAAHTYSQ